MSIDSILQGFGGIWGKAKADKENAKAANKARRASLDAINSLDWEPTYASQTTPQYQKTESPVARSWLESFLAGNNPATTSPMAPNASALQARQQSAQDQMFGTMQQRIAQQRAAQQNPYQVTTPTRPIVGEQAKAAIFSGTNPNAQSAGVDQKTYQRLVELGVIKDGQDLPFAYKDDPQFAAAVRGEAERGQAINVKNLKQLLDPKLEHEWSPFKKREVKKSNKRSRRIVDQYASEED